MTPLESKQSPGLLPEFWMRHEKPMKNPVMKDVSEYTLVP
jgi:hypothetical protein